jgi:hypothetical protein
MTPITSYLEEIEKEYANGDVNERVHRDKLKKLLGSLGREILSHTAANRIPCGPDLVLHVPLGYITTKDIADGLRSFENDQKPAEPYDHLPNWILTDYVEFRWYKNGKLQSKAMLAQASDDGKLSLIPNGETELKELLQDFLSQYPSENGEPGKLEQKSDRSLILGKQGDSFSNSPLPFSTRTNQTPLEQENAPAFPAYISDDGTLKWSPDDSKMLMVLFDKPLPGYIIRRANLSPMFIYDLTQRLDLEWVPEKSGDLQKTIGPDDVFNYAYALFYSPGYRDRYEDQLKTEFPRVPLTTNLDLFRAMVVKGRTLASLHLMEAPELEHLISEFPTAGSNRVDKVQYAEEDQLVWINEQQYFSGIRKEIWEFRVGGYCVCEKWLEDRKDNELTLKEIEDYQRIIVAFDETIKIMHEIDEIIEDHGSWPIVKPIS